MTLEIGKRFGAVRKGRPSGDRGAEPVVEIGIDARAPTFREPGVDDGEQRRVAKRRRLFLLSLLLLAEGIERFLAGDLQMAFAHERLQRVPDPRLPIDQSAVAIEGQGLEVGELHRSSPGVVRKRREIIPPRDICDEPKLRLA